MRQQYIAEGWTGGKLTNLLLSYFLSRPSSGFLFAWGAGGCSAISRGAGRIYLNSFRFGTYICTFWLIGFTEAEGSFYLVSKDSNRIVHTFEITQKLDIIVLKAIALILGVGVASKKTYNTVVTTNSRAISNIIDYYQNTFKGMKAVEFRIWARTYVKHKGKFDILEKVRKIIRSLRSTRLNKNFQNINKD